MNNKIEYVLEDEARILLEQYKKNAMCRIVELDGEKIPTIFDLIVFLESELSFPQKCGNNADRFCDWMQDLSWYPFEQYVFVVWNYKNFVWHKWADKGIFFQVFEETLRFWEFGAEKCIVGGKPKEMHVYLVMEDTY